MVLKAEHLCKAYGGRPVLTNVSFAAGPGVTCIMAPSGAGKTTLLRILMGLERQDSGRAVLPEGCRWGAVFQEDRLLERLDALDNLRFVLGPDMDEGAARAMLEDLGLAGETGKRTEDWSGGMKRRLALARALLAPSDALALDEPFTGLDEESRGRALACVRRAAKDKPALLVTHDERDTDALGAPVVRLG